ncbi:MAG: dephospho-CoA kinase, partial [Gammaproteobacteria bacterium]|nr:dephospho-CoA kinase [Gammaproteobacteria bacterium]
TGGIASGKSAVASILADLGANVVDTDEIARDVVAPGDPGLQAIVEAFGRDILTRDAHLDRRKMREQVFSSTGARTRLEAILHPLIREELWRKVDASDNPVQVLVIPLLVESGLESTVDRVLVVDCPRQIQLERLLQRDAETTEQAERILDAQASREARLAVADDIIDNSGSLAMLQLSVQDIYAGYLGHVGADKG